MEGMPVTHAAMGRDLEPSPTALVMWCFLINLVSDAALVSVLIAFADLLRCSESLNLKN